MNLFYLVNNQENKIKLVPYVDGIESCVRKLKKFNKLCIYIFWQIYTFLALCYI